MVLCLSERHIANVIRQYENLPAEFTSAELAESPHFFARFGRHLADAYGIEIESGTQQINQQTGIGYFRVHLRTDLEQIAEGLQILAPLNVSIERDDLVPLGCPLAVPQFDAIQPRLARLSLPVVNLLNAINDAVGALQPSDQIQLDTPTFAEWAIQNNVDLPRTGASELRRQRFEREAEARKAANDERIAQRENSSSLRIRELPTF